MSFVEAVAAAGGATEDAATQHIAIIRTTKGTKQEVSLDRLTAGDREVNYALEDGDVIYVPRRGIARIGYVLQKISPLTAFSVFATAVTR
jgi:polysaccharide export outer membrane protein